MVKRKIIVKDSFKKQTPDVKNSSFNNKITPVL